MTKHNRLIAFFLWSRRGKSMVLEFFELTLILLGLICCGYFALGVVRNVLVDKDPIEFEQILVQLIDQEAFQTPFYGFEAEIEASRLMEDLAFQITSVRVQYTVRIHDSRQVNITALPGHLVILTSGLLNRLKSENELVFLLAHEWAHFQERNHLRAMSKEAVIVYGSASLFGVKSGLTRWIRDRFVLTKIRLSPPEVKAADAVALGILKKRYGHVSGARELLQRLEEDPVQTAEFWVSHPDLGTRIADLENLIAAESYSQGDVIGLDSGIFRGSGLY